MCPQGGVTSSLDFDCAYTPVLLEGGRVRANMLRMSMKPIVKKKKKEHEKPI